MQAHDFYHLLLHHGVSIQMGGADQWGNITAGIDYIRRRRHHWCHQWRRQWRYQQHNQADEDLHVHGLTTPLLTDSHGRKWGKTAEGKTLWLDAEKTSPYAFYQFWINRPDPEIEILESLFLLQGKDTPIPSILKAFVPEKPPSQADNLTQCIQWRKERLAKQLTYYIHGKEVLKGVLEATSVLFGGRSSNAKTNISLQALEILSKEIPRYPISLSPPTLMTLLCPAVFSSKGALRRLVKGGGLTLNFQRIAEEDLEKHPPPPFHQKYYLLRKGKKDYALIQLYEEKEDRNSG